MVFYTQANNGYLATAIANALSKVLNGAFEGIANWNKRQSTRIALSQLTDRQLNDIGLNRSEIEDIIRR